MKNSARKWTDEQFIEAVKTSFNYSQIAAKLGLATFGANSKTIKKHIKRLELNTSHFWTMKEQLNHARTFIKNLSYEEIFIVDSPIDRGRVKAIIIRDCLLPYECSECKIINWQDKELSLHLDHINGINNDNRLENLRFLCPNCHSQTDTYCGKQLRNEKKHSNKCIDCGIIIWFKATRCKGCVNLLPRKTKIEWPPTSELISMSKEFGYKGAARRLGVSDNGIRKRILNHPND